MVNSSILVSEKTRLISIFVESCLWGIFTMLFVGTLYVLYGGRHEKNSMHYMMLGSAITMWLVATAHLGIDFSRVMMAFVVHRDEEGGPGSYLRRSSTLSQLLATILYLFQTLVGDSFLLFRMAIVWGRDWRIVSIPLVLLIASIVSAGGAMYNFIEILADIHAAKQLIRWIVAFMALTLVTNFVCTALIAIRIWRMNSFSAHTADNSNLRPVMLVIMESGAIYSGTLLSLLICYFTGQKWAALILFDACCPIVGIVFSMVIIRLGLKLSKSTGMTRPPGDEFTSVMSTWNAVPGMRQSESLDKAERLGNYRRDSDFECDRP